MNRSQRKLEHIKYAIESNSTEGNYFDDLTLIHQSISSLHWDSIDLCVDLGELSLSSPLFISAMTGGGGTKTEEINKKLAIAASHTGVAMSVGSQMAAVKDKTEEASFKIVRKENPEGIIFANLGSEASVDQAQKAIHMLEADALQIHLNTLQELIMPEGDRDFTSTAKNIESIVRHIHIPVIVKEVGYGMSKETANRLKQLGVTYIDVSGKGGTNFSKVENRRRKKPLQAFNNWGIPSPAAIKEVKKAFPDCNLLASGGIRNGLDGAKSMVLGAKAFGMAGTLLKVLLEEGLEALQEQIDQVHEEVKLAMLLLDCTKTYELENKPYVSTGYLNDWFTQRRI
ncbi:type 2 isopentenyl-diphosphate Delta-isomerase [Sediminibacillus massiliensis]|uniref:type 2 isopentenyl-diphosphate Delta-isomerase n=1 Tax=Sediminibacillus massiliensis TaxID=1926277 RepID=UPI0009886C30|nr:type 2 isopentenyl-diphosphate Delta-isomerase [Sediminibacillus massiliensis]